MIDDFLRNIVGQDKGKPVGQDTFSWADIIKPETVSVILGRKGFGKSALAYWIGEEMSQKHNLLPVVINLPRERQVLLPSNFAIKTLEDIPHLTDAIIIIDEGTTMLPAGQKKLEEMVKGYVALSRQRNQLILFIFHASADAGSRILRGMDAILLKEPSQRQIQHGSKDPWWKGLLTEAKERFEALSDMGADPKQYTYVDSEEPEFRGMMKNPLPSFWSTELSKAWANANTNQFNIDSLRLTSPLMRTNEIEQSDTVLRLSKLQSFFPDGIPFDEIIAYDADHNAEQLRQECSELGLATSGDKKELAARIIAKKRSKDGE